MKLKLPILVVLMTLTLIILSMYPSITTAQTVAVTGTITDTQSTPYSNGLLTVTFVNATGQLATFGGSPSFQKSYAIYLDANGAFTISLPPNSTASPSIQPSGTQWNFSYQSQGGYGAANINVTITGAGSISGTLSNLARITWPYGNIPPPGATGQGIVFVSSTTLGWGSTGGAGSVTHTAGNLTLNSMMLGNGVADTKVDSACVTNGSGALSGCTSISTTGSISAGSGASAAGATATGGFACTEAANTGWTPTAGQDYKRCDTTLHNFVESLNGAAEVPSPAFSAIPTGGKYLQSSGTGGLIAEAAAAALVQVPATTAANTVAPTVNGVVGLTVLETTGSAADIVDFCTPTAGACGAKYVYVTSDGVLHTDGNFSLGASMTRNGQVFIASTAPTISSGFGTSPSVVNANSTGVFTVNVGTGGTASSGVVNMLTGAVNGWVCQVNNRTAAAAHVAYNTRQTASTTSTVTVENQTTSTGAAVAWGASDIVTFICIAN